MALKKVGGLWLNEKAGKKYFSGKVQEDIPAGSKVFVYRNTYKEEDKHPDYTLHVAVDDDQPRREEYNQAPPPPPPPPPDEDEIPF